MSMPSGQPQGLSGGQRGPVQPIRSAGMSAWVRRHPIWSALVAIVVVIVAAAVTTAARRTGTAQAGTVYVVHQSARVVTPISTITNMAGKPVRVGSGPIAIAVTPDGKTAYVANTYSDTVTPITTATNTAGKPVKVGDGPGRIAITPDGQTAYVTSFESGTVTPITHRDQHGGQADQGRQAAPGDHGHPGWEDRLRRELRGSDTVTPITTATNTAGKPIKVGRCPGRWR